MHTEGREQALSDRLCGPLRLGTPAPTGREQPGQDHVLDHRKVGNEVEHLEYEADVIGAEPVPSRASQCRQILARHEDPPRLRLEDSTDQPEQRALAAATGSHEKDTLAAPMLKEGTSSTGRSGLKPNRTFSNRTACSLVAIACAP